MDYSHYEQTYNDIDDLDDPDSGIHPSESVSQVTSSSQSQTCSNVKLDFIVVINEENVIDQVKRIGKV